MNNPIEISFAESRAKRDDDDKKEQCDLRAVSDLYRDGLVDDNEARALLGLGARDDDKADDKADDNQDERDDTGDSEDEGEE